MKNYISIFTGLFRFGSSALNTGKGVQNGSPSTSLVEDVPNTSLDSAMQISAVWRAVELWASVMATLPLFVYENRKGLRELARDSNLWMLLHESPNSRMTPAEFWIAMILNLLLRGNAYARVQRGPNGEAEALWPMPADQVQPVIWDDGTLVYEYRINNDVAILAESSVFHLKEMGNGSIGLARLDFMRATLGEARNAQNAANKLFANGGKPTGVLMVDNVLNKEQRDKIKENFAEMSHGSTSRLFVLEANMKYQQINLSPADMELLTTRQFSVQEIGRWFAVPAVLLNQTEGTTTLGSSSSEIIDTWYKTSVGPKVVIFEQAIRKRILTSAQRARYTAEFNLDALLRASLKDRMDIYAKAVQNGIKNRNEVRQLENDPPYAGGEVYTAQSNLLPITMLGKVKPSGGNNGTQDTIAQ